MKSRLLTRRQTAGIVEAELKRFYLFLETFGLISILILIACLLQTNVIGILFSMGQLVIIYLLYKSFTNRIRELGAKEYD
jgi:hypothetical protein